jgi:hypothetical protein
MIALRKTVAVQKAPLQNLNSKLTLMIWRKKILSSWMRK